MLRDHFMDLHYRLVEDKRGEERKDNLRVGPSPSTHIGGKAILRC